MTDHFEEISGLLFFDTFSHEVNEDLNLDLVQFPKPVYITEVRIIPLGARVQADFPGGVRLGATNPSKFHIEFFVNDLGKPGASTFEALGDFEYNQNDCINLECELNNLRQIPTDGLVLRGWYTTITLAVYGTLTKNITEEVQAPPPPPTQPIPPIAVAVNAPISAVEKAQSCIEPPVEWRSEESQPIILQPSSREDLYTEEYDSHAYNQSQTYYEQPHEPKKEPSRHRERVVMQTTRSASSESDWDRDEQEELNRTNRRDSDRSSTEQQPTNRSTVLSREVSHTYSRSTSKDRSDYYSRSSKRDWSRSPEYRHSRHSRSSFHERGSRKDKSRERDRRTPDKEYERKRPCTPPSNSPRRPRTPDRLIANSPSPVTASGPEDPYKIIDKSKYHDKGQPIRVIDHMTQDRSKPVSPPPVPAETSVESPVTCPGGDDETMSQGEPFEPILSDEEIGDESLSQFELDYDFSELNDDIIRPFVPGVNVLESYEESGEEVREFVMVQKFLDKYKQRDEQATKKNFDKVPTELRENWVNAAEQFIQFLHLIHNLNFKKRNAALKLIFAAQLDLIVDWIKIGLDFECVVLQPQPGYKIRHLKIGARLVELICCEESVVVRLLYHERYDLFKILFDLYEQKYMALSIKLMYIKAIYSCLDAKPAIEYFVNENGYQRLVDAILNNPITRAKFALKSLMKKISLYEALQLIREIVTDFYIVENCDNNNRESNLKLLRINLEEVLKAYTWDAISYGQPKRFLPVAAKFEIVKDVASLRSIAFTFYAYFSSTAFIQSLLLLIANETNLPEGIIDVCLNLISVLVSKSNGLDLLSNNVDTLNALVKCLLNVSINENSEDEEIEKKAHFCPTIETKKQKLGFEIAYKVKTKFILAALDQSNAKSDGIFDRLHDLHSLSYNQAGKRHVANTISIENNICTLLNLIDREKQSETARPNSPTTGKTNSPSIGYAIDLIDLTVRHSTHLDYLVEHGQQLLDLIKSNESFESNLSMQLQEIGIYLKPLELPNVFAYDNITPLCELLKRSSEFTTTFPGDLITALRLILHLAIPPYDSDTIPEYAEQKYKFVVLQLYSSDGISTLISILEKLNAHFEQPEMHVSVLAANQGVLVTQIILPCMRLLRKMLIYVIQSRNTQFKDLTAIEQLMKTYNLMYHIMRKSSAIGDANEIQREIVQILLAYTQPTPSEGVDTESVHKSLWAQMIGEVMKFITFSPYTFIPGMLLFSELLPLPLPVYTPEPLTEPEIVRIKTERQLWSAHLHARSAVLTELIQILCTSNFPQLASVLSYVCVQLADLAPNMAVVIAKSTIDLMLNDTGSQSSVSPQTVRLLHFLSILILNPQIKASIISILPGKLIDYWTGILIANTTAKHARAQEFILKIYDVLLDPNVGIVAANELTIRGITFTSALPAKDILPLIISGVVENFLLDETTSELRLLGIRVFERFIAIDYTLFLLRAVLETKKESFYSTIEKFNYESVDQRPLINEFIEFTHNLVNIPKKQTSDYRSMKFRIVDLISIFNWEQKTEADGDKMHPLLVIRNTLSQMEANDQSDSNDILIVKLEKLINCLNDTTVSDEPDLSEPMFPMADGIVAQYNARVIFDLSDEYKRNDFSLENEFATSTIDDDKITVDLPVTVLPNLQPELNIISECKRLLHLSASPQSNRERTATAPCFRTRRVEVEPTTGRPEKKIYVTRGRGFPRTPPTRGDLFRSRPPNTSRPPSLHVDDFLALETCGAQPTGPTGYNKLSRDIIGIRGSRGGRGRGFGGDRGRISSLPNASSGGGYRQTSNSPSTWQGHGSIDSSTSASGHFRSATTEPVSSHFQNEYSTGHFGGSQRGRIRGTRPPRTFTR